MNYYPFHLGDYAAHTAHLEPLEDLAYRRMLDVYYLREAPLPSDPAEVARLVRMRAQAADVEAVLREFFTLTEEGWRHARCDEEIERMQDKQAKARASAAASVNARRARSTRQDNDREANAEPPFNDRPADVELPTPTPTPKDSSEAIASGGKPPIVTDPDEIIFGYGVPLMTNAGTPEKQARSFLGGLRKQHGDTAVIDKLRECMRAKPLQPLEWMAAALPPKGGSARRMPARENFDAIDYGEGIQDI